MSSVGEYLADFQAQAVKPYTPPVSQWYAIQTRSRHEKMVAQHLMLRGVNVFLPTLTEVHRWSDRRKKVELPVFSGYVFVNVPSSNEERVRVLRVDGVVRFVGPTVGGTAIPEEQIEAVRALLEHNVPWASHPFLKAGQRIRIRGGALDGMEGIFQDRNGENSLILSVDAIQRSLAVRIEGYDFEVV